MGVELEGAVSAALQGGLGNRLEQSEDISDVCQNAGMTYSLGLSLMEHATSNSNGDRVVNVDFSGATGPMPYMASAMEGAGIRSYAAVSHSGGLMMKVRYSVNTADESQEAINAECKTLHRITAQMVRAIGRPDGPITDDFASEFLQSLSKQQTSD